jgi:hypothetical protein
VAVEGGDLLAARHHQNAIVNFKFQNCDFGKAKRVLINRCAYVQKIASCLGKANQRTGNKTETAGQNASWLW